MKNVIAKICSVALLCMAILGLMAPSATAASIEELAPAKESDSVVSLGAAPVEKNVELKLGALRTQEADLPPPPLTRAERNRLRIRRTRFRDDALMQARRARPSTENTQSRRPSTERPQARDRDDDDDQRNFEDASDGEQKPNPEDVAVDENGEPIDVAKGDDGEGGTQPVFE